MRHLGAQSIHLLLQPPSLRASLDKSILRRLKIMRVHRAGPKPLRSFASAVAFSLVNVTTRAHCTLRKHVVSQTVVLHRITMYEWQTCVCVSYADESTFYQFPIASRHLHPPVCTM